MADNAIHDAPLFDARHTGPTAALRRHPLLTFHILAFLIAVALCLSSS